MGLHVDAMLGTVAQELHIPEDELLKEGLRAYLERRLRVVKAEILDLRPLRGVECRGYGGALP